MIIVGFSEPEDITDMIEVEGLDYFFMDWLSIDDINDEDLLRAVIAWEAARGAALSRLKELGVNLD